MQNFVLTQSNECVKIKTQSNECVFRKLSKYRISMREGNILMVRQEQETKLQRRLNDAKQNTHWRSLPEDPGCVRDHRPFEVLPS